MHGQNVQQNEQLMQIAAVRERLQTSVNNKNLVMIYENMLQAKYLDMPAKSWTKYLVNVFSMLTDAESYPKATFSRRAPVFNIFKLALQSLLMQQEINNFPSDFITQIINTHRSILPIFESLNFKRTFKDQSTVFNKKIQKLLSVLTGAASFQKPQYKLSDEQINILRKTFPFPDTQKLFVCSDLALWYEFFSNLKNYVFLFKFSPQQAIIYISKLKIQCEEVNSRFLQWIQIYNFFKQTIKILNFFPQSKQVESIFITKVTEMLKYIIYTYEKYLEVNQIEESKTQYNANVFKTIIRFNIVLMAYCFIETLKFLDNRSMLSNVIKQTKLLAKMVLARVQDQMTKIKNKNKEIEQEAFLYKLTKYKIQVKWIFYQLSRSQDFTADNDQYLKWHILPKISAPLPFQVSNRQVKDLQEQLVAYAMETDQNENKQASLIKPPVIPSASVVAQLFTQLLIKSPKVLQQIFYKSLTNSTMQIKLFFMLLTEYYVCNTTFFVFSLKIAFKTLYEILDNPEKIDSAQIIDSIRMSIMILKVCDRFNIEKPPKTYVCSLCSTVSKMYWCNSCDQARRLFIYPADTPINLADRWLQYKKKYQSFMSLSFDKVPQRMHTTLIKLFLQYN